VAEAALPDLEARLRALEPDAPILRTLHGRVDPDVLFPPDAPGARARRRDAPDAPHAHDHEAFATEVLQFPEGVAPEVVETRVRGLGTVRAKGFVATRDGVLLLQGVGPRLEWAPVAKRPRDALIGRVVVIRRAGVAGSAHPL
jgi:G3E family GTPase